MLGTNSLIVLEWPTNSNEARFIEKNTVYIYLTHIIEGCQRKNVGVTMVRDA